MHFFPRRSTAGRASVWNRLIVVAALLALAGCSRAKYGPKRVPLAGTVTLNGQPLQGAEITFFNDQDEVGMITGPDGTFSIPTGALPGDYKVTISKLKGLENVPEGVAVAPSPKENPEILPPHFSNRRLTKMTFTVPEDGDQAANFNLKK